jgi:hypothetical protein
LFEEGTARDNAFLANQERKRRKVELRIFIEHAASDDD